MAALTSRWIVVAALCIGASSVVAGPAAPETQPTTSATTTATSGPATRATLTPEQRLLLIATVANTRSLRDAAPVVLKRAQVELTAAKAGPVQKRAGLAEWERVMFNGKPVYHFATSPIKQKVVADLQGKADVAKSEQDRMDRGEWLVPAIELGHAEVNMAGSATGVRAKLIRLIGPNQAIVGFGPSRFWLYGVTTEGWQEDTLVGLPELLCVTGTSSYFDLSEGMLKPVFVLKTVTPFDFGAYADEVKR